MKYAIKLILSPNRENDSGHSPVWLRITIDRKVNCIATGHFVPKKFWDSKNEMVKETFHLAHLINPDIAHKKQALIKKLVEAQVKGKQVSAKELKESGRRDYNNFFTFAESHFSDVRNKRSAGTLKGYKKYLKRVEEYNGSRTLNFEHITKDFIAGYENHLYEVKKHSSNYVDVVLKNLDKLCKLAVIKGVLAKNPFTGYEKPGYVSPVKDFLTLQEIDRIEKLADETTDPMIKQTCVYFLLGCYTGLRVSDWMQFKLSEHIRDGRVYLRATKNKEWITMPVTGRLKKHIRRLKETPLTIVDVMLNRTLKDIAKPDLCDIDKHLTNHTARHSFAITMCANQGISAETCATLMGITLKTCIENYYRVTGSKINNEVMKAWK